MDFVHVRLSQNHMATTFHFTIATTSGRVLAAEQTLFEAHTLVAQLEEELSEFRPLSPVARINRADPGEAIEVPISVLALLERSEGWRVQTQGAFDCGAKGARRVQPCFGWDAEQSVAWRNGAEEHLGFGAIGKGYALDRVRERIELVGFTDFVLDAGGSSLVFSGYSAPDQPWSFGWSWEKDMYGDPLGLALEHSTGRSVSLGISGTHEKGAHLLGSKAGTSTEYSLASSLVACDSAADADALSTAQFVAGWDAADGFLSTDLARAAVASDHTPMWNGRFARLWGALAGAVFLLGIGLTAPSFADDEVNLDAPAAEESGGTDAIDLGDLGVDDFAPYETERDPRWIWLPALSLALVALHLKRKPTQDV